MRAQLVDVDRGGQAHSAAAAGVLDGVPLVDLQQLVVAIALPAHGPGRHAPATLASIWCAQLIDVDRDGQARSAAAAGVLDVAPLRGLQLVMTNAPGPARSGGKGLAGVLARIRYAGSWPT